MQQDADRWRIIQENPQIPFRTKEMDFADKWAAFEWMYKKQLGRSNMSDEQKTYLMGKRNEAEKLAVGTNRYSKKEEVQNGPLCRMKTVLSKMIKRRNGVKNG